MKRYLLFAVLGSLLAACAPQTSTPAPTNPLYTGPVGFYPAAVGLDWVYQPQGAAPTDPPYRVSVLGPSTFNGQPALRFRFSGRGQERYYYRVISNAGVQLLGFEEAITNSVVRFTPPMQEYPAPSAFAIGARWGGVTQVDSQIVVGGKITPLASGSLEYTYQVVGRSNVSVPAGDFQVWRIALNLKPSKGDPQTYEIWFVPGVGEVRTQEGLLLVDRNFK
ncbi:hypothetical protein [Meiothermus granaticius]|uniref:Lipoprotein n=1 Tax=Meiothermus granaticius NBRC 107808 TaxID=1227551 RepID=A0A399F7U4_9DEIN|nr:hypothetical protein [Meiothermus granaticius]RIH92744.1 hypothetical protein Mgrana_01282 [Meiothermus granaticius NBRC 107808]GEM87322.1 hypothetical protein MGR01S_19470 [Meiothermus granaticius NBRC 107808]